MSEAGPARRGFRENVMSSERRSRHRCLDHLLAFCATAGSDSRPVQAKLLTMSKDAPSNAPAVAAAFLQQFLADAERGTARSLADYQHCYPGHEQLIAAEFAELQGSGANEPAPREPAAGDASRPDAVSDPALIRGAVAERYEDEQELARGGMGTIYRVFDPALKRTIAKKVLGITRKGSTSIGALMGRFLGEAQVTAQLDHPGIVPVHELGIDADGRVYFTMSLVRGRNLHEIIELVRQGRDGWTRTRALGVLQRVCEAVAFAHSKGVIHRDLKPANIMVGPFGQTYVLDWGLARVGTTATDPSEAASVDWIDDAPHLTREGDVMGTPAYMAPEQARGEIDAVGPRSDVYAIGAMLYHLLGGRIPYADAGTTTWQAMLDATLSGPPTPLREIVRDVPEELVAIQERAMARDPGDRYASAQDLGEDLRAFLEMRVVRAHRTGAFAELRKWVRRNRVAAVAAALALLSLVAGLGTSLWLRGIADESAEHAVLQLEVRQAVLDFLNKDLLASVAPGALGKDVTMREALDQAAKSIDGRFPDQPLVEAAVRRTIGDTYRRLGELPEAERHLVRSVELFTGNGAEPSATLDARRVLGIVYGEQNRLHEAANEGREILALSNTAFGPEHDDTLTAANNLGLIYTRLGRWDEAEELLRRAFETRHRTLGPDHDHTLVSMCNLGLLYYNTGRLREAEPLIKGELDLCAAKHGEANPGTLVSMNNYANLLAAAGRYEEALREHERIFRISEQVEGERHPHTVHLLVARSRILLRLERWDECRSVLEIARVRASDLEPDHTDRLEIDLLEAQVLVETGQAAAALPATADLLARFRRVAGDHAMRTSGIWRLRAKALRLAGKPSDGLDEIDAAIAALGDDDTGEAAQHHILRGQLLADLDRDDEAEAELLRAERYFREHVPQGYDHEAVMQALIAFYDANGREGDAATWRTRLESERR
ncbi:MAG: serine/threonine protein kinase [Planctomycetes bacterium]|nr:serine/threonine protein kinase [Planctomycetota bacterium]